MVKALGLIVLLALAGCSGLPQRQSVATSCATPGTYACQIELYMSSP